MNKRTSAANQTETRRNKNRIAGIATGVAMTGDAADAEAAGGAAVALGAGIAYLIRRKRAA